MRSSLAWLLLAFACGVCVLQGCARLPPWPLALVVTTACALVACWRRHRVGAAIAALVLGFGYAAWRAEVRLADALAREWEGEDIRVHVMPLEEALQAVRDGRINNAASMLALQWLALNRAEVRGLWS